MGLDIDPRSVSDPSIWPDSITDRGPSVACVSLTSSSMRGERGSP
jgi:hypothetical protein